MTTPKSTGKLKFKTFNCSFVNFILLSLVALTIAGFLFYGGFKSVTSRAMRPPYQPDPIILTLSIMRMAVSVLVVFGVGATYMANVGKSVTVSPVEISCNQGNKVFTLTWHNVIITPSGRKPFRTLLVSDGTRFYRVEEFFFPDFDLLFKVVRSAVEKERDSHTV